MYETENREPMDFEAIQEKRSDELTELLDKRDMKPARVFEQFANICEIPRPSKREEKMIEYLRNWGASHNLETKVDKVGNVLIKKGATPGHEDRLKVIIQSHLDMVCD